MNYGAATEKKIKEVLDACEAYGESSIIALSGVPATGKSFVAAIAAQRHADEPTRVREIQFHQSFSYEEFVEGLRIDASGAVQPFPGAFLDWNDRAVSDGVLKYVLLIEELTRANVAAVLGELLTYVEHRERQFFTLFSKRPVKVALNLTIIATFNPIDRAALSLDDALLRRLRIIDFPPDVDQLQEMLTPGMPAPAVKQLQAMFEGCRANHPDDFETLMPFGHGIFAEVDGEGDLYALWHQRIKRLLRRPLLDPHPFTETIEAAFPWKDDPAFRVAAGGASGGQQATSAP